MTVPQFAPRSGPASPAKHQANVNSHVFHTSAATKDDLDKKFAEFVFGCNLALTVVEHPQFIAMMSSLRPGTSWLPEMARQVS